MKNRIIYMLVFVGSKYFKMNKFIFLIFFGFINTSLGKNLENFNLLSTSSIDNKDTAILRLISNNKDIITQCLFSTEIINYKIRYVQNKRILDVNILDSLVSLNNNQDEIYRFILLKKNLEKNIDYVEVLNKWCSCYRIFESIFIFNKASKSINFSFENIAYNITELKPIFYKYCSSKQLINSLSYSQSQMIYFECLNYCSQLDGAEFLLFFKKFFESSIYYLK